MNKFLKIKKSNFLENDSNDLGIKEVIQKIQEPISSFRRGQKKYFSFLTTFKNELLEQNKFIVTKIIVSRKRVEPFLRKLDFLIFQNMLIIFVIFFLSDTWGEFILFKNSFKKNC